MTDYYQTLGVNKSASDSDIKAAYRKLARKYHPDVSKEEDATAKFQEIQQAYSVLKDSEKRRLYDAGVDPNQPQGGAYNGPMHDQPFGGAFNFNNIEDFINEMLHKRGGARQRRRVTIYEVHLTLEEAFSGAQRTINDVTFTLPAGMRDGSQVQVDDFIVKTRIAPHAKFKRAGDDLLLLLNISVAEAALGTTGMLRHIDGNKVKFTIPPCTQPGQVLRLAGKGMPNPEYPGYFGDLHLHVNVQIPEDLTDEQKEAIMKLDYRDQIEI